MQLGQHHIPEARLYPGCISDVKSIYDAVSSEPASSLDVAKILGYSSNTNGAFYRRLESLEAYGLVERHGKVRVSNLGKRATYAESDTDQKLAIKDAVLHVSLWAELFKKFGKKLPSENLWVQIKNITGIEAPAAQKVENVIRKYYDLDVSQISEDVTGTSQSRDEKGTVHSVDETAQKSAVIATSIRENTFGRLLATDIGNIDITDEDTLQLARSTLNIIEKKINAAKSTKLNEHTILEASLIPANTE